MIPKIIHYAWFGNSEKPKNVQNCIDNWKKVLPDFQIVEWNEKNAPLHDNKFVEQAYEQKMWAFVSDYVRIAVIHRYGGIYLDTDVNLLKSLTPFLSDDFFTGFESEGLPFTAVFGAVAHHPVTESVMAFYRQSNFEKQNMTQYINTKIVSDILINEYQCDPHDSNQLLKNGIHIYSSNVLCNPSTESFAIHIRNGSWLKQASMSTRFGVFLRGQLRHKKQIRCYLIMKQFQNKCKNIFSGFRFLLR